MKTIFRFAGVAILLSGFAAVGVFAQDDVCADIDGATAVYNKFTENYAKPIAKDADVAALETAITDRQAAVDAGKQFLEKWGACESWKDQVAFVKPWVPKVEKTIDAIKLGIQYKKFDTAMVAKNWDGVLAAGSEIDRMAPDKSLDQMIAMGMIGLVETYNKNNNYNDQSLNWARKAIDKMNSGSTSVNGKWGVFQFAFGSKDNAVSELSYGIGYVLYYGKGDKKGGVAQLYKVTQLPGSKKDYAPLYATIGEYYLSGAEPVGSDIATAIKKVEAAQTPEDKAKIDAEEVKPKIALFNGYAERAMDAYGRAWSLAKTESAAGKTYKEGLMKQIQDLYKRRTGQDTGAEQWVSTSVAKQFPDPTSTVQPVTDPDPADTNTTNTTNTTTTNTVAKPAATTKATPTGTEAAKVGKNHR